MGAYVEFRENAANYGILSFCVQKNVSLIWDNNYVMGIQVKEAEYE